MGRQLTMTAELGDWLAELCGSQPARAAAAGAALAAVLDAPDPAGLGCVAATAVADPREAADRCYQQLLTVLQRVRREAADAAAGRRRAELRLERAAALPETELAELRSYLAAAQGREDQAAEHARRIQGYADAFRTHKETAKATYTAAEARLRITAALDALGADASPEAELEAALRSGAAGLAQLVAGARETLRATGDRDDAPAAAEPGLLELQAGPAGEAVRILLALEPPGTVTLLAALDGDEAIREHGAQAARLAAELLAEIRGDGWPDDLEAVTLADSGAFLARFFPADDGSLARRAADLAAAGGTASLGPS